MNGVASSTSLQRYATALAVSLVCHAIFFVAILRRTSAVRAPSPLIAITIRQGGGDSESAGGPAIAGAGAPAGGPVIPATSVATAADVRVETNVAPHVAPAAPAPVERSSPREARTARAASGRYAPRVRAAGAFRVDAEERATHDRAVDVAVSSHDDRAAGTVDPSNDRRGADDAPAADRAAPAGAASSGRAEDPGRSENHDPGQGVDQRGGTSGRGTLNGSAGTGGAAGEDLRARCAACPAPEYPARARRQGWEGTVDVTLHVGADGAVEAALVGRSSGFALLDAAAVTVARQSRFHVTEHTSGLHGVLRYRFVLQEPRAKSF